MRILLGVSLVVVCFTSGGVRADDAEAEAKAIVQRAVKAMGGEEKLAKIKIYTAKGEGKFFIGDDMFPFTEESYFQPPGQYRFEYKLDLKGTEIRQLFVFNGDKGWSKINDLKTMPMPKDTLGAFHEYFHAFNMMSNPPTLLSKEISLSPVGEVKVNDRPALGVRVVCKGRADVNFYFDKETGLPVKCDLNAKDYISGQEVPHEVVVGGYKEIDGAKVAMQLTWTKDSKKFMTRELTEVRPTDRIDAAIFAEP
jgi:hypothetical protein